MAKVKTRWKSIGIPQTVYNRLKKLIIDVGCPSIPEYVRQAIDMKERYDRELLLRNADVDSL